MQRRLLVGLVSALLMCGCVTEVVRNRPLEETTLIVGQSGTSATLQWQSSKDVLYTVLYADNRKSTADWKPLPGHVKIRGTGRQITIEDRVPYGEQRQYRLHVEPIGILRAK